MNCSRCQRTTDLSSFDARDAGWLPEPGKVGQIGRAEICPECTVTHGYRSQAQYEAVCAWYRRQKELGEIVLAHVCDDCGTILHATRGELRKTGWKKTWRRAEARGLRREYLRCEICSARTSLRH